MIHISGRTSEISHSQLRAFGSHLENVGKYLQQGNHDEIFGSSEKICLIQPTG